MDASTHATQRSPAEARNQAIVGVQGEQVADENSKVLLAIDGTEAGEKAFQFLLKSQILNRDAHIFSECLSPPLLSFSSPLLAQR